MKKAILWILALLVLCGCTAAALEAESAAPESTVPPVTEPVAETQAPPDPLARLQLVLPQNLTASAGHPSVSLAPEFSGLDPDAAVDCTLTLTRDGQTVYENPDLCLTPDTRLRITFPELLAETLIINFIEFIQRFQQGVHTKRKDRFINGNRKIYLNSGFQGFT